MFAFLLAVLLAAPPDAASCRASGDAAFVRIAYEEAAQSYRQGLVAAPEDPDLLWRLARVLVCTAEVEEDAARRGVLLQGAEDAARRAIAADSACAEAHTWLAGALGYKALEAGMGDQVAIARELMDACATAIRLNPADDAAYSIRGSFYRALGNIGWVKRQLAALLLGEIPQGGHREAEEALRTAIRLAPDIMRHQYELGVLYIDEGRTAEAREALRRAASLEIRTAIDRPRRAKALHLLRELEGIDE